MKPALIALTLLAILYFELVYIDAKPFCFDSSELNNECFVKYVTKIIAGEKLREGSF